MNGYGVCVCVCVCFHVDACLYTGVYVHVHMCGVSMYEMFSHHPTLLHLAASSQTPCLRMYHKCFHVFIFIETENTKNNPYP